MEKKRLEHETKQAQAAAEAALRVKAGVKRKGHELVEGREEAESAGETLNSMRLCNMCRVGDPSSGSLGIINPRDPGTQPQARVPSYSLACLLFPPNRVSRCFLCQSPNLC